jgi:hypothetical protein
VCICVDPRKSYITDNAHLSPGDRVVDATSRRVRDPAEQKPDAVLTLHSRISPPVQLDVVEPVNIRTQFDNPQDEHQLLIAISLFSASSSEVRRGQRVQKPSGVFMGPVFPPPTTGQTRIARLTRGHGGNLMQSMPAHENHSAGQKHAPSGLCSSMAGRSIEKHINDCENPSMPTFPPCWKTFDPSSHRTTRWV